MPNIEATIYYFGGGAGVLGGPVTVAPEASTSAPHDGNSKFREAAYHTLKNRVIVLMDSRIAHDHPLQEMYLSECLELAYPSIHTVY